MGTLLSCPDCGQDEKFEKGRISEVEDSVFYDCAECGHSIQIRV